MRPLLVDLSQDVEDEGLHVKIKRLVVEEQFGQKTKILTVNLQTETEYHLKQTNIYRSDGGRVVSTLLSH